MIALLKTVAAIALSISAQYAPFKHPVYADPNSPNNYLQHINAAFQYFHRQYGYFPEYWYDIQVNCRERPNDGLCGIERNKSRTYRKTADFPSGRYKYVITASGKSSYNVRAIDRSGCARFAVAETSKVVRIEGKCNQK